MPNLKPRNILLIVVLVLLVVSLSLLPRVVFEGRHHVETASIIRHAGEEWQNGNTFSALTKFVTAVRMIIEGGTRSIIARPFMKRSLTFEKQGRLAEALDYCARAVRILGRYDDEGSSDYRCMTLNWQIQQLSHP